MKNTIENSEDRWRMWDADSVRYEQVSIWLPFVRKGFWGMVINEGFFELRMKDNDPLYRLIK